MWHNKTHITNDRPAMLTKPFQKLIDESCYKLSVYTGSVQFLP